MQKLTPEQLDALREFINIGVGRAASLLNEMVNSRILLEIPVVRVFDAVGLQKELAQQFRNHAFSAVRLGFTGDFCGIAELIFPTDSASALVSVLTGEDLTSPDLDAVKIGTLSEVGNIVINGIMGSISNLLEQHFRYTIPVYLEDTIKNLLLHDPMNGDTVFLLAKARFTIEALEIIGDIILIFEVTSFDNLLDAINRQLGVPL